MHMLTRMLAACKRIALKRRMKVKRKIIFFLSTLILSAALSSSALASSIGPGVNVPTSAVTTRLTHRHDKSRFGEKEAKAFVDGLVADNVIPRETGDKLLAYFDQKREAHKADREKIKSMSEEERKAYFKEQRAKRDAEGPFAELIKDGTMTKAQADAITKALREYKKK